ncbi:MULTISPECIES: ATP-binding cassette domain-containing protein [Gordonia]|uniref:ATP-binding cassette domain-containing protein n=1 Tax=Gordonia TaxID=2053 RepID=UPI00068A64D7
MALSDFSWRSGRGLTVLLGPNGAGKSTLLGVGANSLRPTRGTVRHVDGRGAVLSGRDIRRAVGWMPQTITPVVGLTCREQVAYYGWVAGMSKSAAWASASDSLRNVDLSDRSGDKATHLSGGQLRRLGLAQTLVSSPSMLLLDEPTAGLDPSQKRSFRQLVRELAAHHGIDIIISTHETDELSSTFDAVAVLDAGRLCFSGSASEFMSHGRSLRTGVESAERAYSHFVKSSL